MPYVEESLNSIVLQYIDALSSGIVIAACIEYTIEELRCSPRFQQYCQELCEKVFHLAYSQVELYTLDDESKQRIDEYCCNLSHHILQTVYLSMLTRTIPIEPGDMLSELTAKHKQLSFNSASDLDDYLERISEGK